jgi:hypothetical protein
MTANAFAFSGLQRRRSSPHPGAELAELEAKVAMQRSASCSAIAAPFDIEYVFRLPACSQC